MSDPQRVLTRSEVVKRVNKILQLMESSAPAMATPDSHVLFYYAIYRLAEHRWQFIEEQAQKVIGDEHLDAIMDDVDFMIDDYFKDEIQIYITPQATSLGVSKGGMNDDNARDGGTE